MTIQEKYEQLCLQSSDINLLLPYLYKYSRGFDHITEFGIRQGVSTHAFMMSRPKTIRSYDIARYSEIDSIEELAKINGIDFKLILENIWKTEIEETDVLLIDSYHVAGACAIELELHSPKVKHRILFHDVAPGTFWEVGETPYDGIEHMGLDPRGLKYAIEPFMTVHPEWKEIFRTDINNGLLVLERQK